MRSRTLTLTALLFIAGCRSDSEQVAKEPAPALATLDEPSGETSFNIERITTAVPFPRGLQLVDGKLFVLCRGRVREAGGVTASIEDMAGTIFEVDPTISEPLGAETVSDVVRTNGKVLAAPSAPPFKLWDRTADPPTRDHETDRPYCSLRYHAPSRNFFLCAFSGIDKPEDKHKSTFSKNLSDAILRYDLRSGKWYEVERHNIEAGGLYPHHDPAIAPPPHGWLNGPDNCCAVGKWLYAVSKDNSRLVRYDLSAIEKDPESGAPPSEVLVGESIEVRGLGEQRFSGHSALAASSDHLYMAFRTSSEIIRIPLGADGLPRQPIVAELVARFDSWDPATRKSANVTDIALDSKGRLCVISAKPSKVYRFTPDPNRVFDARGGKARPWVDMAKLCGNPDMKSENLLLDEHDRLYITGGDAYDFQKGAGGVVYRVTPAQL